MLVRRSSRPNLVIRGDWTITMFVGDGVTNLVCIAPHGAEFDHGETSAAESDSLLNKERLSAGGHCENGQDQQHDW